MSLRLSISLTLLTVLSFPAEAVPTYSQINHIAQRICQLPEREQPTTTEIKPGLYYDPQATAIYNQEMGELLDSGDLLPIQWVNKDLMESVDNRLVGEIYARCQRHMGFTRNLNGE